MLLDSLNQVYSKHKYSRPALTISAPLFQEASRRIGPPRNLKEPRTENKSNDRRANPIYRRPISMQYYENVSVLYFDNYSYEPPQLNRSTDLVHLPNLKELIFPRTKVREGDSYVDAKHTYPVLLDLETLVTPSLVK